MSLAARQVHLDFHTSEHIKGIGSNFSKANFQQALKIGNVNSITLFAKCHHSWCYYPTKVGKMHPYLNFDLLGSQIKAAKEIGVKAPIYITVGWSATDAGKYLNSVCKNLKGETITVGYDVNAKGDDPKPDVSWICMCPSGEYAEHIYHLTEEICKNYKPVDGIFFDICFHSKYCFCDNCMASMKEKGIDPANDEQAFLHLQGVWDDFAAKCTKIIKDSNINATIFFNGGANPTGQHWHKAQTHFEMEDLPTTWGGYDKMPPRAKYFAKSGKEYLGMTGKFHTIWGEFGGFKHPEALKYEVAAMMAYGAKCSVGDQAHPSGEMDLETYKTIGFSYEYAKQIQDYCFNIENTAKLGIIINNIGDMEYDEDTWGKSTEGLVEMLLQNQIDFQVIGKGDDFTAYDAIILHDSILLGQALADKLNIFLSEGGGLLITGESGLDIYKKNFLIDVGVAYLGNSDYNLDYVKVKQSFSKNTVQSPFLFYDSAIKTELGDGEVLAELYEPYFNRTYSHYCSHKNAPYKTEKANYPAAVKKGRAVYLAHNICKMYKEKGARYHREYFINALNLIYSRRNIRIKSGLSSMRAILHFQPNENRFVFHILYAPPMQRGDVSVLEDFPVIYNVETQLLIDKKVSSVMLAPQGKEVDFSQKADVVNVTIPKLKGHQIIVLNLFNGE